MNRIDTTRDLCATCGKSFARTERRTVFDNKQYHQKCLACSTCHQPLSGAFYPTEEGLQCEACHGRVSVRCHRCGDVIRGNVDFKVLGGHHYHNDCFVCCSCGKILSIAKESDEPGKWFQFEGYPQCANCHLSHDRRLVNINYGPTSHDSRSLKPCAKCKRQISRNDVFYSYEDVAFHKECFICNRCGVNLVGKTCHRLASAVVCDNCS